jgi:predicted amidophosphoribosyltransferase
MPLRVVSCCTYLTSTEGIIWRPRDYDAHDFVLAVKAKSINGYCQVPCRGQVHRIHNENRDLALEVFANLIEDAIGREEWTRARFILVPVPNSLTHLASQTPPRTAAQAEALTAKFNGRASVWDVLRWTEPMLSARSQGGTRDPQALFDKLIIVRGRARRSDRAVLVDDTLTSGGHLQACAAVLQRAGIECDLALAAGRSDRTQVHEPFSIRSDVLADFTPHGRNAR